MVDTPQNDGCNEFIPPWLEKYLQTLSSDQQGRFLTKYCTGIKLIFERLAASPMNQGADGIETGKFSARIPGTNKFVNLKSALWTGVKYGAPFVLATTLAVPLVGMLGITVGAQMTLTTIASACTALYDALASLNAVEMDTYIAVAAAIERNKNKILGNSGASIEEIMQSFTLDKQLMRPHDPEAVLQDLVEKKVLTRDASAGVEQYFLAF